MNRRDAIAALTSACSAAGLTPSAMKIVSEDQEPILAVIHCDRSLPAEHVEAIRKAWERARKLHPKIPPCVVVEHGLRIEFVTKAGVT